MTTSLSSSGRFHALRLPPGTNLVAGLRSAVAATRTQAAAVVTCVGSLTDVRLRHADRDEATVYAGRFEILSLVGTLDPLHQHLHLAIADGSGQVRGGHLLAEGSAIHTTAEIVLLMLDDLRFAREPCAMSGYCELVVAPRTGPDRGAPERSRPGGADA